MSEHTPGPWLRDGLSVYAMSEGVPVNRFYCRIDGGYTYHDKHSKMRTGEVELAANAQLAASAPDLLEALRLMLVYFGHPARAEWINDAAHAEAVEMCVRARATIAKATQP